jgi:hypothetical protein
VIKKDTEAAMQNPKLIRNSFRTNNIVPTKTKVKRFPYFKGAIGKTPVLSSCISFLEQDDNFTYLKGSKK